MYSTSTLPYVLTLHVRFGKEERTKELKGSWTRKGKERKSSWGKASDSHRTTPILIEIEFSHHQH
jgi:hypothetical protein